MVKVRIKNNVRGFNLCNTKRNLSYGEEVDATIYKVCKQANVTHQAGADPDFCGMNRLGVYLLPPPPPPGWNASPSRGYPSALSSPVPIYTHGWRDAP